MGLVYFYILAFQTWTAFMSFSRMATETTEKPSVILYKYKVFKHFIYSKTGNTLPKLQRPLYRPPTIIFSFNKS